MLGKSVSLQFSGLSAVEALDKIAEKAACRFSYKSDILPAQERFSIVAVEMSVKQVLDELFQGRYHYSEKSSYIIIHPGGERQFVVSGFVRNGRTGELLPNVTVYEDQILASAMTNEKGYFRLPIKNRRNLKSVSIIARKEAFTESYAALSAGRDHQLDISIVPDTEIRLNDVWISNRKESGSAFARFLLSSRQKMQSLNIGDFLASRPVQTSIVPGLGTHRLMGAQVVNHFSLNWVGGYTAGVNGAELGGAFNINRGDVRYFQAAGVFNSSNSSMSGFQSAGVFNWTGDTAAGFQAAGVFNFVGGDMNGFQTAGILNQNRGVMRGFQSAGIANRNRSAAAGFQAAGLLNDNDSFFAGFQASGLYNYQGVMRGVSIAGLANSADRLRGVQVSGLLNHARHARGLQLGLVNVADTMEGIGLGLINIYRNGYHTLALTFDEMAAINVAWLSGTKHWYTVLNIAASSKTSDIFHVDYGFGSRILFSRYLSLQTDLSLQTWYAATVAYTPISLRLQSSLVCQVRKRLAFFAGLSYTATENKWANSHAASVEWLPYPQRHYDRPIDKVLAWRGFQLGVRIL